jgi:hypothetical protein
MPLWPLAALAAATLLTATTATATQNAAKPLGPPAAPSSDTAEILKSARQAGDARDWARAAALMAQVVAAPDFTTALSRKQQSDALGLGALYALQAKDLETAYRYLVKATDYPESLDFVFTFRISMAGALSRWEDTVVAVELASRLRPAALNAIDPATFANLRRQLRKHGDSALETRFFNALVRADYRPETPFHVSGYLWIGFAADLADAGDTADVHPSLAHIDHPWILAEALLDRRLFPTLDGDPDRADVRALAERRLAKDREDAAAHPRLLEGVNIVASDLRRLGRPDEALALLDSVAAKVGQTGAFEDEDLGRQLAWCVEERARALRNLGRPDEATAALEAGARLNIGPGFEVYRRIDLADTLNRNGKPEAALAAIADDGAVKDARNPSYARMLLAVERVHAYARLGRRAEMQAGLAYIRAHEPDAWSGAIFGPIYAGDLDAAAAALVRALDDPDGRGDALLLLSHFDPTGHESPDEHTSQARLDEIAARPEVRDAIAKAGRIMRFHVVSDYY